MCCRHRVRGLSLQLILNEVDGLVDPVEGRASSMGNLGSLGLRLRDAAPLRRGAIRSTLLRNSLKHARLPYVRPVVRGWRDRPHLRAARRGCPGEWTGALVSDWRRDTPVAKGCMESGVPSRPFPQPCVSPHTSYTPPCMCYIPSITPRATDSVIRYNTTMSQPCRQVRSSFTLFIFALSILSIRLLASPSSRSESSRSQSHLSQSAYCYTT